MAFTELVRMTYFDSSTLRVFCVSSQRPEYLKKSTLLVKLKDRLGVMEGSGGSLQNLNETPITAGDSVPNGVLYVGCDRSKANPKGVRIVGMLDSGFEQSRKFAISAQEDELLKKAKAINWLVYERGLNM